MNEIDIEYEIDIEFQMLFTKLITFPIKINNNYLITICLGNAFWKPSPEHDSVDY